MVDEFLQTQQHPDLVQSETSETRSYGIYDNDPYLEEAIKQGWKPPEEFEGDPKDHKSPKNYVEYGNLLAEKKKLSSHIESTNAQLKSLADMFVNMNQKNLETVRQEYEERLQAAADLGDYDEVQNMSLQIYQLKQQEQQRIQQENQKIYGDFVAKNSDWLDYTNNPQLAQKAETLFSQYRQNYPQASYQQVLDQVENDIRSVYLKTQTPPVPKDTYNPTASAVNKSAYTSKESDTSQFSSLTQEQKDEYNRWAASFKQSGIVYTKADYIKDLNKR